MLASWCGDQAADRHARRLVASTWSPPGPLRSSAQRHRSGLGPKPITHHTMVPARRQARCWSLAKTKTDQDQEARREQKRECERELELERASVAPALAFETPDSQTPHPRPSPSSETFCNEHCADTAHHGPRTGAARTD